MYGLHICRRQFGYRHGIVIGRTSATAVGRWKDSSLRRCTTISARIAPTLFHARKSNHLSSSHVTLGLDIVSTAHTGHGGGRESTMDACSCSYSNLPIHLDPTATRDHAHSLVDGPTPSIFQGGGCCRRRLFASMASSMPSRYSGAQHMAHCVAFVQSRHGSEARQSVVPSRYGGRRFPGFVDLNTIAFFSTNSHSSLLQLQCSWSFLLQDFLPIVTYCKASFDSSTSASLCSSSSFFELFFIERGGGIR
jgi:hypothetical protein